MFANVRESAKLVTMKSRYHYIAGLDSSALMLDYGKEGREVVAVFEGPEISTEPWKLIEKFRKFWHHPPLDLDPGKKWKRISESEWVSEWADFA